MLMGRTGWEPLSLARLSCDLGDPDAPEADVARNILALLARQEAFAAEDPKGCAPFGPGIRLVMLAACISRTPDVALPRVAELADAESLAAAAALGHRPTTLAEPMPMPDNGRDMRRSSAADHLVIDSPTSGS
jgi:hypothetical protein